MLSVMKYFFLFLEIMLFIACNDGSSDSEALDNYTYGEVGSYSVDKPWEESENHMSVLYAPLNMEELAPLPIILFAPEWKSVNDDDYKTLLTFIASHGYMVVYAKDDLGAYGAEHLIEYFNEMLNNRTISAYIDYSRIGVIGHSSGAGHAFKILKAFSDEGWGENGRFLLSLEPWFAFDMNKSDMQTLPSNTNVLVMQFGKGGENLENNTDPRIPLSEYYLLSSIDKTQKDYQVVEDADHHYPEGDRNYTEMQGLLKPLDALMEYTFKSPANVTAHQTALEVGSDNPELDGIQVLQSTDDYHYRCDGDDNSGAIRTLVNHDIDYCTMEK